MSTGVDFATSSEDVNALKAAGVSFVCRYLSGGGGKDLTTAERDRLLAAGLGIVVVWETDGRTGPLTGAAAGPGDAAAAVAEAQRLGAPPGTCIYFAVDFDVLAGNVPALRGYFTGLRPHMGPYRLGDYGGFLCVESVADIVDLGWQTYAWSGGRWSTLAHLQQYQNGAVLAGIGVDYDRNTAPDFGQWGSTTPQGDDLPLFLFYAKNPAGVSAGFVGDGLRVRWIRDGNQLKDVQAVFHPTAWGNATTQVVLDPTAFGSPVDAETAAQLGVPWPSASAGPPGPPGPPGPAVPTAAFAATITPQ